MVDHIMFPRIFFNPLQKATNSNSPVLPYIYLNKIAYIKALTLQRFLVESRIENKLENDLLLLVQHPPTYTTGRSDKGKGEFERLQLQEFGAEYHETLRGGQITFHGPGQLVGYPILDLRNYKDTGVWVNDQEKICAIGIQVQRYITSHGFALNCNTDLNWFNHIIPCGLENKQMTSISKELSKLKDEKEEIIVEEVLPNLCNSFGKVFDCDVISLCESNLQSKSIILNYLENNLNCIPYNRSVNLPDKKLFRIALTYFYGIGPKTAQQLCSKFSIHNSCKVSDLSESQLNTISLELSNMTLESDLRRKVKNNILHHRTIGDYKGKRHAMGYPVRGQRTRTNAKTARKLNGRWLRKEHFTTLTNPTASISSNIFVKSNLPLLSHFRPFERFFSSKFFV
ncbi:11722_t:CDS:2 [Funneliformis geosporum]|nr:11722_t:CDS:2 [Funneliformis geosporum]